MTERCLASGGGEAEETGHSEESGVEGGVKWSERGVKFIEHQSC